MDSPVCLRHIGALVFIGVGIRSSSNERSPKWIVQPLPLIWQSLSSNWLWQIPAGRSSKPTASPVLNGLDIEVRLLPAQYVRAYVKRNKTDAADAAALLEAARASDMRPVRIKSVEQQALQGLHRIRSLWMGTRTSRINALRGFLREFGIAIPVGARTGLETISRVLADPGTAVPALIRGTMALLVDEIRLLEARIGQLERELSELARPSPACTTLLSIRQLVRADAQGVFAGQFPLPAHAAHTRTVPGACCAPPPWHASATPRCVTRSHLMKNSRSPENSIARRL